MPRSQRPEEAVALLTSRFGWWRQGGRGESGEQTRSLEMSLEAIRRSLGECEEKRLLQEREVGADTAAGEQLSQLARLSSA
jgi:hypothetical protein